MPAASLHKQNHHHFVLQVCCTGPIASVCLFSFSSCSLGFEPSPPVSRMSGVQCYNAEVVQCGVAQLQAQLWVFCVFLETGIVQRTGATSIKVETAVGIDI
jgi:hypothetical protein